MDYDITLKTLLMGGAPAFLGQLAGTRELALASIELPAVVSRTVDLLGTLPDRRVLHTEVQSGPDSSMPRRMLGYYWMILEKEPEADVVQIVLYVGGAPLRIAGGLTRTGLSLTYQVIDIRSLDPAPLLASDRIGDIVTSFLCRADDIRGRVREILHKLLPVHRIDPAAFRNALTRLVLLGNLRGASDIIHEEIRAMPVTLSIKGNVILERMYAEARNEGLQEGKAEGKAESLLRLIGRRFGPVPAARRDQVAAADVASLDRWLDRIFDAPTLEAVFEDPKAN